MPDDVHGLFPVGESTTLSSVVKSFKARSAHQVSRHLNRQGDLWQKAYYDHAVREEEGIRAIARYVVANPLRAGLVEKNRGLSALGSYLVVSVA